MGRLSSHMWRKKTYTYLEQKEIGWQTRILEKKVSCTSLLLRHYLLKNFSSFRFPFLLFFLFLVFFAPNILARNVKCIRVYISYIHIFHWGEIKESWKIMKYSIWNGYESICAVAMPSEWSDIGKGSQNEINDGKRMRNKSIKYEHNIQLYMAFYWHYLLELFFPYSIDSSHTFSFFFFVFFIILKPGTKLGKIIYWYPNFII